MNDTNLFQKVVIAIRASVHHSLPDRVDSADSLVSDLGFDSMSISLLGLALEDQFDRPILLDDWIRLHPEPDALTVRSLCEYLSSALGEQDAAVMQS